MENTKKRAAAQSSPVCQEFTPGRKDSFDDALAFVLNRDAALLERLANEWAD